MTCHGHLIGELVRHVTGSKLSPFVAHEIARPLGAGFLMGVEKREYPRIATHVLPTEPAQFELSKLDPLRIPAKAKLIDAGRHLTISFVMNTPNAGIIGGPRASALINTAYACPKVHGV